MPADRQDYQAPETVLHIHSKLIIGFALVNTSDDSAASISSSDEDGEDGQAQKHVQHAVVVFSVFPKCMGSSVGPVSELVWTGTTGAQGPVRPSGGTFLEPKQVYLFIDDRVVIAGSSASDDRLRLVSHIMSHIMSWHWSIQKKDPHHWGDDK